jgi:hypothetical protein
VIRSILLRIAEGVDPLSLPYMEANAQLLAKLSDELWEEDEDYVLIGDQKLLSWFERRRRET